MNTGRGEWVHTMVGKSVKTASLVPACLDLSARKSISSQRDLLRFCRYDLFNLVGIEQSAPRIWAGF